MSSFWKERTAFVTGATGFVGAHIVRHLLDGGAKVVCLERDTVSASSLDMLGLRDQVTIVHGQLEDFAVLERVLN